MAKLSNAQQNLLDQLNRLSLGDTLSPPSGRAAGAWWRTATSLVKLGLAKSNGHVLQKGGA